MYIIFGMVIHGELMSEIAQREQRVVFRFLLFFSDEKQQPPPEYNPL
jgi:hypothetical protein